MVNEETKVIQGGHLGIAATTPVHIRQTKDGGFKARCGVAIMGCRNMNEAEMNEANHDPFHPGFYDNWAEGEGVTEEGALAALKADMQRTADSLWEI